MTHGSIFGRPSFLPPFEAFASLGEHTIAITGQRGVLGGILERRLHAAGSSYATFPGDVTDRAAVDGWLSALRPALVFHMAAIVPIVKVKADPVRAFEVNAVGAFNVAAALARHVPGTWLFLASSSHVYAPSTVAAAAPLAENAPCAPSTLYGTTKRAAEELVGVLASQVGLALCIGRIFSFFHERQSTAFLVPGLLERARALPEGGTLEVRDANSVRDILDADEVIDAVLHLAAARYTGIVNIASGQGRTVASIAQCVLASTGRRLSLAQLPSQVPTALVADARLLRALIADRRA